MNGRRCQLLEKHIDKDAEAGEVVYGTVVRDQGATIVVEVAGTQYAVPAKRVNVADERGHFAKSLNKYTLGKREPKQGDE